MNIRKLQYFVGKACTIFTTPINRNYKDENPGTFPKQMIVYFTGFVSEIDDSGVWLTNPMTGKQSFWAMTHLVGIAEEEVLDPKKDAAEIAQMQRVKETAKTQLEKIKTGDGPYVNPEALANISAHFKSQSP